MKSLRAFSTKPDKKDGGLPGKEKKEGIPERKKPGRPKKEKVPQHDPIPSKVESTQGSNQNVSNDTT